MMNDYLILSEGEKVLLDCPAQPTQIYGNMVGALFTTLFLGIFFTVFFAIFFVGMYQMLGFHPQTIVKFVIIVILIIWVYSYFSLVSSIARSRYVFTDQRCILIRGIGFKGIDKRSITYGRIADVNISQGFIQSFFGIADVFIDEQFVSMPTNNTCNNRNLISGVTVEDAEHIARLVSEHVNKKS